jgi:hypothetical protein
MDPATSSNGAQDWARWAFSNFLKLFMEAGYLTQPRRLFKAARLG